MLLLLLDFQLSDIKEIFVDRQQVEKKAAEIFTESTQFSLDDLFELRYGVLELRYKDYVLLDGGTKKRVIFIRPGMIDEANNKIIPPNNLKKDLKPPKKSDESPKLIEVPEKYYLTKDSILINTRGVPRYIDTSGLSWGDNEHVYGYVASNHFITLNYKTNILKKLGIKPEYISKILRFKLMHDLEKSYQESVDFYAKTQAENEALKRRSISSIVPARSIDMLKTIKIAVPDSIEKQEALIALIEKIDNVKRQVENYVTLWYDTLTKN